jgi:hypothetical protein
MASMSYGDHPGGEQEYDTGQAFGAPPSDPDQPEYAQPGPMPPTYRVWGKVAVVCGLLFNTILGGGAAYLARRESDRVALLWENGNLDAAVMASRKARAWLIASGVFDVLGIILLIIVIYTRTSSANYSNPSVVASSIKTFVQQSLSDRSGPYYDPGVTVTSVVCTPSGTNTDHCVLRVSTGEVFNETAIISGHGTGYYTTK